MSRSDNTCSATCPMYMRDYYADLQVSPEAEPGVIRAAYRYLARAYHPDVVGAAGAAQMRALNEAYEVLSDSVRRSAYDDNRRAAPLIWLRPVEDSVWPAVTPAAAQSPRRTLAAVLTLFALIGAVIAGLSVVAVLVWQQVRPPEPALAVTSQSGVTRTPRPTSLRIHRSATPSVPQPDDTSVWDLAPEPLPLNAEAEHRAAAGPMRTVSSDLPEVGPPLASDNTVALPVAPPAQITTPVSVRYIVQPGDSVARIAGRFGVSEAAIVAANALVDPDRIAAGQVLHIPE